MDLFSPEREAYAQMFWESLPPDLREILEQVAEARTWVELAKKWETYPLGAQRFVQKKLRRRLEEEGVLVWLKRAVRR